MKQEFINFIDALIAAAPDVAKDLMTEEVKAYLEALKQTDDGKPELTDNGKLVLAGMQKMFADSDSHVLFTAKKYRRRVIYFFSHSIWSFEEISK